MIRSDGYRPLSGTNSCIGLHWLYYFRFLKEIKDKQAAEKMSNMHWLIGNLLTCKKNLAVVSLLSGK
jgi:hypothetical protein